MKKRQNKEIKRTGGNCNNSKRSETGCIAIVNQNDTIGRKCGVKRMSYLLDFEYINVYCTLTTKPLILNESLLCFCK